MLFKEALNEVLEGDFAYKNGQPQKYTISRVIAQHEGKEYVPPNVSILNKIYTNAFIISEDAEMRAFEKCREYITCPLPIGRPKHVHKIGHNPDALHFGNWYIYVEEGINVGYILVAIHFGNVPILPSFFREDFEDCAVYYDATLVYPHYRFSLGSLYRVLNYVSKNERLYYTKVKCLTKKIRGRSKILFRSLKGGVLAPAYSIYV